MITDKIQAKKVVGTKNKFVHKWDKDVEFKEARVKLGLIGASQVAEILTAGHKNNLNEVLMYNLEFAERVFTTTSLKKMTRGKEMEGILLKAYCEDNKNLIRNNGDKKEVYKNKYINGKDKYAYIGTYNGEKIVSATPDAWCYTIENIPRLIELKNTSNYNLIKAAREYNNTGNYISYEYFYKYYIQVQMQLACTGLTEADLYIDFNAEGTQCLIKRDDAFIQEIFKYIEAYNRLKKSILYAVTDLGMKRNIDVIESHETHHDYIKLINYDYVKEGVKFIEVADVTAQFTDVESMKTYEEVITKIKQCQQDIKMVEESEIEPLKQMLKKFQKLLTDDLLMAEDTIYKYKNTYVSVDKSKQIKDRITIIEGGI